MFSKNKNILFHNHSTIIKIRKLPLVQCNCCRPYSDFTNCTSNVLNRKNKFYITLCVHLSCLFSVLWSVAVGYYCVFVFYDLWWYLMRIGQLFLEFPQYGFVCCCFMIRFRSCIFGRTTPEVILCPLEAHDVHLSH